jgi:hypothetical protein
MPALCLQYDHCARCKPRYLNKAAIEAVAREARAQLSSPSTDALTLEQLAAISDLTINGLSYQLWVSLDHPVTDEDGQPVLGLCEFDPDCGEDAVSVLVSPVGEQLMPELALSTFAHELGHAVFDAPAWLAAAKRGPGLFDEPRTSPRRARRTATPDAEHLGATALPQHTALDKETRIAEFRANEFMGSLLVPRDRLVELAVARAPDFDVGVERDGGLSDELHAATPRLVERGTFGFVGMENLQRDLAATFGVTPKFIRVRMERYGLLPAVPGRGQG